MADPNIVSTRSRFLILLLIKTHSPFLVASLGRSGYAVSQARSPDHLVALCLSNPVDAVIVDICQLGEIEGWSVAQSIKMAKPSLPVILLFHGPIPEGIELPAAVDALASDADLPSLVTILDKHTVRKSAVNS